MTARRRNWPVVMMGAGLVALGGGTLALASGGSEAATTGPNVPVNRGARDPADLTQNNSPSVARNPRRPGQVVVVNRIDNPRFSCALHVSANDGATWTDRRLPFPEGEEAPPRCFAPDAAFGPDGTLYVSFVTLIGLGNTPNALWVASSGDGGRSFSEPVKVAGPLAFQVRVVADQEKRGRLYLTWLQAGAVGNLLFAEPGNPVTAVRSDDGGRTWSDPVQVNSPGRARVVAPVPALGAGGRLYVAYLDLRDDVLDYHGAHEGRGGEPYPGRWSLLLARSGDEGATWEETVVERALVPTERFVVFLPPTPSLVVDGANHRVHVAFTDGRLGDADVWLWTSTDGGRTFAPPARVNDTPRKDGTSQYLPRLALSEGGRLDVVYYDRRDDAGDDTMNRVSLQSSTDGGRTFGPRVAVSDRAFDSRIGFGSERGLPDLGSRIGLLSEGDRALAVWTDTRSGTEASGKQDLAAATVTVARGSASDGAPRALGAALAVAGLAVLGVSLLCRSP